MKKFIILLFCIIMFSSCSNTFGTKLVFNQVYSELNGRTTMNFSKDDSVMMSGERFQYWLKGDIVTISVGVVGMVDFRIIDKGILEGTGRFFENRIFLTDEARRNY